MSGRVEQQGRHVVVEGKVAFVSLVGFDDEKAPISGNLIYSGISSSLEIACLKPYFGSVYHLVVYCTFISAPRSSLGTYTNVADVVNTRFYLHPVKKSEKVIGSSRIRAEQPS